MKNEYWHEVSPSEAKPGDIMVRTNHVEMVSKANPSAKTTHDLRHLNYGSSGPAMKIHELGHCDGTFDMIFSLNEEVQVTPTGSVPESGGLEEEDNATEDPADEFYYQGLQQGSFAGQSSLSLEWLFNLISQLADYVAGFMTMMIKMVVVGWANIIVNIVTDAVDAITGEAVEEPVEGNGEVDGNSIGNTITTTNTTTGDTVNTYDDQKILENDELYTPTSTELQPEGDDKLTIDKIIFNKVPLLDVNVFSDTAGGYKLKDDSSLQIIRDSVASWYYIIRNITIAVMLIILIYVGIRMAITTVASEKAEYKRMLVSWVVGFLIIFLIQYFLILVLNINSTILGWIMKSQNSLGFEDGIYETVRRKAYEIKFSSGMAGTILYIILIILMIKFLYVYLKRFLAVCILIVMAPMMGASYAISKVRTGKAKAFTRWMKDYTLLVLIQSVHALIYTIFLTVVLEITNESLAGIVLALIVMNFMLKAANIFTSIFGMVGDKTGSKSLGTILGSDPKKEIFENIFKAKAAVGMVGSFAAGAVEFGKDLKDSLKTGTDRKKEVQAQALGLGNLGKKALGKSWRGIKNIDAATGQYVPTGDKEVLKSLSQDTKLEMSKVKKDRKNSRKKFVSELKKTQNNKMLNALKLTTAFPLMGIHGFTDLGTANLVTGGADVIANTVSRRTLKNNTSKIHTGKFHRVVEKIPKPLRTVGKVAGKTVGTIGKAVTWPVSGVLIGAGTALKDGYKTGQKIQTSYENRMEKINEAKEAESKIIDLYTRGRREKEDEIRNQGRGGNRQDEKIVQAMAKTSFDDSYRRTMENVYEVSDIVDDRIDKEDSLSEYKASLGFDDRTINRRSIEEVKARVKQKARDNIAARIREAYGTNNIDPNIDRRICEEVEARVAMFTDDLDMEIETKIETHKELFSDLTYNTNIETDFSETINTDTLKSTIEDIMKRHNADKKVDREMEELRDEMQRLQRIDREYANSKDNKDHTYLYKTGPNVKVQPESRSNLKNVLSSLTFRNIDINGERR
ncbi:MAG TPA: hypothetical protein OIM48_02085 [Clostridiaceae bacterium]|nr:hypothetical protein [Clostridiaceae bacterium]